MEIVIICDIRLSIVDKKNYLSNVDVFVCLYNVFICNKNIKCLLMLSNGNDTFVNNRELFTDTKS